MQTIYDNWSMWQRLLTMLQNQFGDRSEFVLHDLTKDYSHTIVDIRNGHITNRSVGDCGSNLGLEVLRGTIQDGDRYNYIVNMRDGKLLRSSTMYIRNSRGKVVALLSINFDISALSMMDAAVRDLIMPRDSAQAEPEKIVNVNDLLEELIQQSVALVGKPVAMLNKADKVKAIQFLNQNGAFLVTKSGDKIAKYFGISKYTLYSYIDTKQQEGKTT